MEEHPAETTTQQHTESSPSAEQYTQQEVHKSEEVAQTQQAHIVLAPEALGHIGPLPITNTLLVS